jgi:hypothetical protein
VISGLGSCLIGSIFDASLLGNLTFSVLSFLTYLIMAAYLVEVDRARTSYQHDTRSIAVEDDDWRRTPGVY